MPVSYTHLGEVMVCLVINAKKLPYSEEFVEMIKNCGINLEIKSITVNINRENTNVILGEKVETLYGQSYICLLYTSRCV